MKNTTKWQLVNPAGVISGVESFHLNPRPHTLDGKTVLLRWNGKHNGDVFLNRIAELLTENIEGIRIIKSWEVAPETVEHSYSPSRSKEFARKLADYKPDIVIGAQAD